MTPEEALNLLAACARKVLVIEQMPSLQAAISALLPLVRPLPVEPAKKEA